MAIRNSRNPIMRHLQRHARLASIYRLAEDSLQPIPQYPAAVTSAYLWPTGEALGEGLPGDEVPAGDEPQTGVSSRAQPAVSTSQPGLVAPPPAASHPAAGMIQAQPAAGSEKSNRGTPETPLSARQSPIPTRQSNVLASRRSAGARDQAASVPQRLAAPTASAPVAHPTPVPAEAARPGQNQASPAGEAGEEMGAATWNRLETIFHRHQAAESAASPAPLPPPTGAPRPSPESELPASPALIQLQPAPLTDQPAQVTPPTTGAEPAGSPPTAFAAPALIQRAPADPSSTPANLLPGWPEEEAGADAGAEAGADAGAGADTGEKTARLGQRLPLEAVWPVERSAPPAQTAGPLSPEPTEIPARPTPETTAGSARLDQLRSRLAQVTPGQGSNSSVELIPTRRPRPAVLHATGLADAPAQPALTVEETEVNHPSGFVSGAEAVQNQPSAHPAPISVDPAAVTLQRKTNSSPEAVQSPPSGTRSLPVEPPAGLVPTSIGDLPADLWSLIGQPPPPAKIPPAPAAPIQTSPAADQSSQWVQRAEEDAPGAPNPAETNDATKPVASAADLAPTNAPDLDQLARSVYAEVRRRLTLEWERMHRR